MPSSDRNVDFGGGSLGPCNLTFDTLEDPVRGRARRKASADMDVTALVLADGDRTSALGRLVRDRGDWFEQPLPEMLVHFDDPPVWPAWRSAVPVVGADFSGVSDRREHGVGCSLARGHPAAQALAGPGGSWPISLTISHHHG